MAKSLLFGGGTPIVTPPLRRLSQEELSNFSNWIPSNDSKEMASDLSKRGLHGATGLITEQQSPIITGQNSKSYQSSWKTAAIQRIISKARELGLKTPTEVMANKNVLIPTEYKAAINDPFFNQIHSNFWDVVNGIYKDQLNKEATTKK
jgi:hypothetical protein